jgi:hypothetical protein
MSGSTIRFMLLIPRISCVAPETILAVFSSSFPIVKMSFSLLHRSTRRRALDAAGFLGLL